MGTADAKSGGTNAEKGTKNSFYLKQQLGNRTKANSKDRSSLVKGNSLLHGGDDLTGQPSVAQ